MAQIVTYVCDKCTDKKKEAKKRDVFVLIKSDVQGMILPHMERQIGQSAIDMCDDCYAWYRRNVCSSIIPIDFYYTGKDDYCRYEFNDSVPIVMDYGGIHFATEEELDNEPHPVSKRYISRIRAIRLPRLVADTMDDVKKKKSSSVLTVYAVDSWVVCKIIISLHEMRVAPQIKKYQKEKESMKFTHVTSDDTCVKFYDGKKCVYEIQTNLRK